MRNRILGAAILIVSSVVPVSAQPQSTTPWLTPTYQSPRGLERPPALPPPILPPPSPPPVAPLVAPPPPIVVPQTGIALPNIRTLSPSGPRGRETYQDRAARCHQQAGAYGSLAGDRNYYINSCINQ